MKVVTQRIADAQVVLEIEVEPERLERSLDKAYRRLVQRTEVPGFRKGKAPRPMLERYLGRHRLLHEALDILVPEVYREALEAESIEAIDMPQLEVVSEEPPVIKATVPVQPTVELGDYRSLRLSREPIEVTAAEVEEVLADLRQRYALHLPVERPVAMGDIVRAQVRAMADGRELFADDDYEFRLRDGQALLLPGFAEGLLGARKGQPLEFTVTIPEDYSQRSLAGKPCTFTVTVHDVKEERLPELNDDFAREVGEGFPSLQALRQRLEGDIRERKQAAADQGYRDRAVDALVAAAQAIEFPPVLVEREVERLLREEARAAGQDVERYLAQLRRSPEDLRAQLRIQAEERVRRSLALGKLAELEGISVEAKEIDEEIERMATAAGPQGEQIRRLFGNPDGRQAVERSLLTQKTLDRLVAIVSGQGPETVARPTEATA